jgi:hypothetical protein
VCIVQGHQEVAGLLGGPCGGEVAGDAGDAHPPGAVPDEEDEEQDEQPPQEDGVRVEDIDGEDSLGLGGEERRPGAVGTLGRRVDVGLISGRVGHEPHSVCAYHVNAPETAKQRVDSLQAHCGAEAFHGAFAVPGRLPAVLGPVVQALAGTVLDRGHQLAVGGAG